MENERRELPFLTRPPENSDPTPTPPCAIHPPPPALILKIPITPTPTKSHFAPSEFGVRRLGAAFTTATHPTNCNLSQPCPTLNSSAGGAPQLSPARKGWDQNPSGPLSAVGAVHLLHHLASTILSLPTREPAPYAGSQCRDLLFRLFLCVLRVLCGERFSSLRCVSLPGVYPTQSGRPLCSLCGKPFSSSATSALPCPELRGERYP